MKILLLISLFFFEICQAQLCIISDKDGYSNVREKPNQNSKIIGKIIEEQVFEIDSYMQDEKNKSKDWIAVKFPIRINKNPDFLRFEGEEKTGYLHKSRLKELENLPEFEKTEVNLHKVIHHNKDTKITIESQAFVQANHKITQSDKGFYLIDGEKAMAYNGGESTEIKSIVIKSKNSNYTVPKTSFRNLLTAQAVNTRIFQGSGNEVYIVFDAGDGADSYNIVFCIRNNRLFFRTITSTIP